MIGLLAIGLVWILGVVIAVNYSVAIGVALIVAATAVNFVAIRRSGF